MAVSDLLSSEAEVYEDATENWTGNEENRDEDELGCTKVQMSQLLKGIDRLVEK